MSGWPSGVRGGVHFVAGSALFVGLIRKREELPERKPDRHLGREIMEGLRFVLRNRLLRSIAMCTGSSNLFSSVSGAMMIVLLARGRANGQIARELHITPQTVKTHVSNILSKLNSRSRTEAALHAMRVGLVPVHETGPPDLPDGRFTR